MSLQPVLRYSLDLSGNSPNNLVVGEVQTLSPVAPNRSIAPQYGAFYTQGLKVRDVGGTIDAIAYENIPLTGTAPLVIGSISLGDSPVGFKRVRLANQTNSSQNGFYQYTVSGSNYTLTPMALGALLTAGVDYVPTMLHQDATRVSGKEVCQLIVITNQSLLGDVVLEYQTVGGEYSVSSDALEQLIEALNLDNRPVVWGEIIGLPNAFPPVDHLHHIQDFKGFGEVVDALDDIRAMLSGELVIGTGGGNAVIHVGTTPPVGPALKTLWWNSETLRLFIYYEDLTGGNVWVEISGSGGTGTGGGGGTQELISVLYPAKAAPVSPDYTYIGEINLALVPANFKTIVLNVEGPMDENVGSAFSGQLILNAAGTLSLKVLEGDLLTNPFYFFQDNTNNKIVIMLKNVTDRSQFLIWGINFNAVTLTNTVPTYTLPPEALSVDMVPQQRVVYESDVEGLFLGLINMMDSVADHFNDLVRPTVEEPIY